MRVVEFAFIVYPSTDEARSRAFYEGILGLTPATHDVLLAHDPFDLPGCRAAIIVDPDGNKLGIHQRKRHA